MSRSSMRASRSSASSVTYPEIEGGVVRLGEEVLASEQSVLFIDADLNRRGRRPGPGAPAAHSGDRLIGVEAPSRLKAIMRLGATATLRKPIYGGSVYSALFVGVNAFRQRRAMTLADRGARAPPLGRRHLMKAIVAVMKTADCDEDAAYDRLRRESMRQRLSIEELLRKIHARTPWRA